MIWGILGCIGALAGYLVGFALMRSAGQASRQEERLFPHDYAFLDLP